MDKFCCGWNAGLCLCFSKMASCSTEKGKLCFFPLAYCPLAVQLTATQAGSLAHLAILGIWLPIWSEVPRGSHACKPAVGAAGKADLEDRLWQAGETSPQGKLHVFHWEGSWQACLLHRPTIAVYSLWAARVRLPACSVPAVVKQQIFIFLSFSMFVLRESTVVPEEELLLVVTGLKGVPSLSSGWWSWKLPLATASVLLSSEAGAKSCALSSKLLAVLLALETASLII